MRVHRDAREANCSAHFFLITKGREMRAKLPICLTPCQASKLCARFSVNICPAVHPGDLKTTAQHLTQLEKCVVINIFDSLLELNNNNNKTKENP